MSVAQRIPRPILPPRDPSAHKGIAGHLAVIGGQTGMSGAVRLAARAALATGAGLVSLLVPDPVRAETATAAPDWMTVGLPATDSGGLALAGLRNLRAASAGARARVLGPGCGKHPSTAALVRRLEAEAEGPLVIDAEGLRAIAAGGGRAVRPARVWTPHPGEAAGLLGRSTRAVQADRPAAARDLVALLGGVVVLKGAGTLVAAEDQLFRSPVGNAALAVAGAGDVLSGICGALLAAGHEPLEAALAAVWLHGASGDRARERLGVRPVTASGLIAPLEEMVRACEA